MASVLLVLAGCNCRGQVRVVEDLRQETSDSNTIKLPPGKILLDEKKIRMLEILLQRLKMTTRTS